MPKRTKRLTPGRVVLIVVGALLGLVLVAWAALAIMGRVAFANFYDHATPELGIPGTNEGFVVQDEVQAPDGSWLFSGYETDGSASPVYRVDGGQTEKIFIERPDGSIYDGHGGGVTCDDGFLYLTEENGCLVVPLSDVLSAGNGTTVKATALRNLGIDPAFLTIIDGDLYAGVFYKEGPYDTPDEMHLTCPDGTENHAVMYRYERQASSDGNYGEQPVRVYSIPGLVQGVCVVDGVMVLSQSWGLSPSELPGYDVDQLADDGTYQVNGEEVPLTYLDGRSLVGTVTAPPMSEGLVEKDGAVWFTNEAASNKYIYGKLFGSWNMMALDWQGAVAAQ